MVLSAIFWDLSSCRIAPPLVDLPPALDDLFSVLPPLDELSTYNAKTSANLDLICTLQNDVIFLTISQTSSSENIKALAQPIAMKMFDLKRPLPRQLSFMSNYTTSIWMGIVISMLLHLLVGYFYNRVHHYQKMLPLHPRHPRHDNPSRLKPVLLVEDCEYHEIKNDPKPCKKTCLMPRSIIIQNWSFSAPENPYADIHENTPSVSHT